MNRLNAIRPILSQINRPLITARLSGAHVVRLSQQPARRSLFFFYGPGPKPYEIYNERPGPIRKLLNYVPAPIKLFGVMAGSAAVLLFVATPLLIIATPPLCLAVWWYGRKLAKMRQDLYNQRWNNMGSYHLTFNDRESAIDGFTTGQLPNRAKHRILAALEHNEQGISSDLGLDYNMSSVRQLVKFTPVESIHQDFKGSSQGFKEEMEVSTYGLLNNGYRRGDVTLVVVHKSTSSDSKMRIEIETARSRYVLENDPYDNDSDVTIEVKGR
ncbi:hypothetical protein TRVA0_009S00870 [Trichomonascus vanleenenianus]|uniref:uncharacterized protein n=1 Tax=Trichomonascus vanleenenianus TaxID=2268995 RepID=UPI003ECAC3A1